MLLQARAVWKTRRLEGAHKVAVVASWEIQDAAQGFYGEVGALLSDQLNFDW